MGCYLLWSYRKLNWERIWRTFWKEPIGGLCESWGKPGACRAGRTLGPPGLPRTAGGQSSKAEERKSSRVRQGDHGLYSGRVSTSRFCVSIATPGPHPPSPTASGFKWANEGERIKFDFSLSRTAIQELNCPYLRLFSPSPVRRHNFTN